MKNIKYIIILLVILLVILLIAGTILIYCLIQNNKEKDNFLETDGLAEEITLAEIEPEKNVYIYIYSNDIMNKMFDYISEKEPNVNNTDAILSILDSEYIAQNNITKDNVIDILSDYKDINSYISKEIYRQEINYRQNLNGEYIYIYGIVRKNGIEEKIYVLLKRDLINSTYSISFIEEELFNKVKKEEKIDLDTSIDIEKNNYNEMYSKMINEYEICSTYFKDYINTVSNNITYGYELLDEEYKSKRFESLEKFEEYIKNTSDRLSTLVLTGYNISEKGDYTQYACVDQYGNNYIFNVSSIMQYSVILDTYTLDLPEFIEKYDSGNDETKLTLNVGKVIEAINNKDYEYVYNKLNETFRNNNFSDISIFEKFIENNFYEINEVVEFSYKQEGNVYVCTMGLKNKENSSDNLKSVTILIQLLDNRNFEISFSV